MSKTISPRLRNKDTRLNVFLNLPPEVKKGIRKAAKVENSSVSWVIEQIIEEWVGIQPEFKNDKSNLRKKRN